MPENLFLVRGFIFDLLTKNGSILEFSLLYKVLSYSSPLTSDTQLQSHTTSSFIPRTQLSTHLFIKSSATSPRELSSRTLEMKSNHGLGLSTKWTSACYFHKPPTPTCWLEILFSFRGASYSSPWVLLSLFLSPGKGEKNRPSSVYCQGCSSRPRSLTISPWGKQAGAGQQSHLPPRELVFNCSLKSLSKYLKPSPPTQGRPPWTLLAILVSFLPPAMGLVLLWTVSL